MSAATRPTYAWSFSALEMAENCLRKFHAVRIAKSVGDGNKYNAAGQADHKAFEGYLKKGAPLPEKLAKRKALLDHVATLPGKVEYELGITLTKDLEVCKWNDWDRAWLRVKSDLVTINGGEAKYIDWKSGKFRPKDDQIELTSLAIFAAYPKVEKVTGSLVFYNYKAIHPHTVYREQAPKLWGLFTDRLRVLDTAYATDEWPATPNGLCGYCPVLTCPHNRSA